MVVNGCISGIYFFLFIFKCFYFLSVFQAQVTEQRLSNAELENAEKLRGMRFCFLAKCIRSAEILISISFLIKIAIVTRNGTYMVEQSCEAKK